MSRLVDAVKQGYNAKRENAPDQRRRSPIFDLKKYNNWVKACLINKYLPAPAGRPAAVFDFCGGKGGDLRKFLNHNIGVVVLADLSNESVQQAIARYTNMDTAPPPADPPDAQPAQPPPRPALFDFHAFDTNCFGADFLRVVEDHLAANNVTLDTSGRTQVSDPAGAFDLVSCQFAIHYAFESEETARSAVRNVARLLRPGGHFIGTTVNAYAVVKKLRTVPGNGFGNRHYRIEFPPEFDKDAIPTFGAVYSFRLEEAIDDIPESLLPFGVFHRLCEEHGLALREVCDFHHFFERYKKDPAFDRLFTNITRQRSVHPDRWEIIGYYIAFVFEKVGDETRA